VTQLRATLSVFAATLALQSCGFVHEQEIVGPYRLVAVDSMEDMMVCYQLATGDCVGRVGATVFAVQSGDTYIVAARHPKTDKLRTEYFYIIRALDKPEADPAVAVRGPYDEATFKAEQARLRLPAFASPIGIL
jgi:hypothetical protein